MARLVRHTAMRVLSASGEFYRVRMPDGVTGFVSARLTESADRAIATMPGGETILARPIVVHSSSDVVAIVEEGESIGVLGRFGEFALVRSSRGVAGWVMQQ
jgi:SH3-like domain-containing protein